MIAHIFCKHLAKTIQCLSILLIIQFLSACQQKPPVSFPQPSVTVDHPQKQLLVEWNEYAGRFRAQQHVDIRARIGGYLDKILFTDGQLVKKGDVLFEIDQRPLKIELERAQAQYELSQKAHKRASVLAQKDFSSQEVLDQRLQEFRKASADLNEAKLNLEYSTVISPINGRVGRHLVDVGNLVNMGSSGSTLLTTVVSSDPIDFYFIASEQDLLTFTHMNHASESVIKTLIGRKVNLKLTDMEATEYEGVINFVDNEIDKSTGSFMIRAEFANKNGMLLPGLFARVQVASSLPYQAILVPENIIGTNQTQKFVYVLGEGNTVDVRPVVLGPLHGDGFRIIRSGLNEKDVIIIDGIAKIRPGMTVSVVK